MMLKNMLSTFGVLLLLLQLQLTFFLSLAQEVDINQLVPGDYNSLMRPGNPLARNTLNVSISVYMNDLVDASDKDETIQLDFILVQQWYDRRLNASSIGSNQNFMATTPTLIRRFWLPELYLVNGLGATVVNAMQKVQKLSVNSHGLVSFAQRISAQLSCPMNLANFPHDYQYCPIKMSTLIYNQSEIRLHWKTFQAGTGYYPIFKITYWWTAVCEGWENPIPVNSCISGTLKMVRRLPYYIIRYYLLTFLTVVISLVNFWVPVNAWPAKITLLVMPLLNLITQDISVNNDIGVYYVTSFHWWMMWCQGFVYLEIIAYAVAISWANFVADKKHYAKLLEQANTNPPDPTGTPAVPPFVKGYYFGNKGWYHKLGEFFDRFTYFFFGHVDYQLDPFSRNKVDYVARVVYTVVWIFYVFLYVCITVIYWSANFYYTGL